jgi:Ca2+/Na+ antiporter
MIYFCIDLNLVITMFIGFSLAEMHLGRFGWGLMVVWVLWCIIFVIAMEVRNRSAESNNTSKLIQ